jgi:hypothetical protein
VLMALFATVRHTQNNQLFPQAYDHSVGGHSRPTSRFLPAGKRALVPQISSVARTSQKQILALLSMLRINCVSGHAFDQMAVSMAYIGRNARTY